MRLGQLFQLPGRHHRDDTGAFTKSRPKNPICVLEHAVLQTDNDKLRILKPSLNDSTDVLGVGQIEGGVDFVKNVHGCRLELQKSENKGQRH